MVGNRDEANIYFVLLISRSSIFFRGLSLDSLMERTLTVGVKNGELIIIARFTFPVVVFR